MDKRKSSFHLSPVLILVSAHTSIPPIVFDIVFRERVTVSSHFLSISNVVFRNSKLSDFQFLNSPTQPLNNCAEAEIDNYMCKLLDEISDKLGLSE